MNQKEDLETAFQKYYGLKNWKQPENEWMALN